MYTVIGSLAFGWSGSMRHFSWVLVMVPFLACCGGKGEHNSEEPSEPEDQEQQEQQEPEALITDCTVENSEAECELYCHISSGEAVAAACFPIAPGGPISCSCEGGPSAGRFFSLSSCDDLEASMQSVCAQTSPAPPCPSLLPASGQPCSHRQMCWIEEFSGDCSAGQTVRSSSVGLDCVEGFWRETGVAEDFCP